MKAETKNKSVALGFGFLALAVASFYGLDPLKTLLFSLSSLSILGWLLLPKIHVYLQAILFALGVTLAFNLDKVAAFLTAFFR